MGAVSVSFVSIRGGGYQRGTVLSNAVQRRASTITAQFLSVLLHPVKTILVFLEPGVQYS